MAGDLDIPQISVLEEQSNCSGPHDNSSFPLSIGHAGSPFLSPTRSYSLDAPCSPASHTSDASSLYPPPSPTLSALASGPIRWAPSTVLCDDTPEEHVSSISGSPTDRDIDGSSSLGLGLVHPGRSDVPTGFFKSTVQRVRHPSPSRTDDIDSNTTRNRGDNADGWPNGAERRCTTVLDLKQEADLNVEPFTFKPCQLADLVDFKSLMDIESLGGVEGLLRGLGTNRLRGLSTRLAPQSQPGSLDGDINAATPYGVEMTPPKPNITSPAGVEGLQSTAGLSSGTDVGRPATLKFPEGAYRATIEDRQRIYGQNILPRRPSKSLLLLMWLALQDKVMVLLSIAAVVSLALGLFQDFGTTRPEGQPPVDWIEGVAIIATILIVVVVGSLNDWQRERQFQVLDEKKEARLVKVIRDGGERQIDVHQVVVGDVVLLEPGEVVPCDGVFLSGHNMRCDESGATGESDAIKKLPYEECIVLRDKQLMQFGSDGPSGCGESASQRPNPSDSESLGHADCFILSGSKVLEGVGSYVVISVRTKRLNGRIMMVSENTPLQLKLNVLAEAISKIGGVAGGLFFVALLIRYFVQPDTNNNQRTSSENGVAFVNILIIAWRRTG